MNMQQQSPMDEKCWFYEIKGQRLGGVTETEIVELINSKTVSYGTTVWRAGFPEWLAIENTELRSHLEKAAPPPLSGKQVNNTLVWILAFAPLLGLGLEYFVAGMLNGGNEYLLEAAVSDGKYWYITVGLNLALCLWDANRLKMAGVDTRAFKGLRWLVPVYLYQRAKFLNQNKAYFVVWIICFFLALTATQGN